MTPPLDPLLRNPKVRPLITADRISARCRELGEQISADYDGKDLTLVCILKGSMTFFCDLARQIRIPMRVDTLQVSSYHSGTHSSGVVKFISDLSNPIEGRHVLLVEDIVDTGLTMSHLFEVLATRHPASLKLCSLLDKPSRRKVTVDIDYLGFTIPDEFVVGYGLDYGEFYRNLPDVSVLEAIPRLPEET
jgi:hypoxanthine phosphoribosyltransferase